MSIASMPDFYFLPCVILLIIMPMIVILCLAKIQGLRKYRKKRNWLVYGALIVIYCLAIYQVYDSSLGTNYVSFGVEKTKNPIYSNQQNQLTITCRSSGNRAIAFYMTVSCANATLQTNNLENYIQVNDTAIKIPFSFNGNGEESKPVFFTADTNVSSISFYPLIERQRNDASMYVSTYIREIQCTFDSATRSFIMADISVEPTAVP